MTTFKIWTDKFVQSPDNPSWYKGQSFVVEAATIEGAVAQIQVDPGHKVIAWTVVSPSS